MNEQFQQLYDYVNGQGMTDLDAQSFHDAYSDPEKFGDLYAYVKGQEMTDLDEDEFYNAYFGDVKKKDSQSDSSGGSWFSGQTAEEVAVTAASGFFPGMQGATTVVRSLWGDEIAETLGQYTEDFVKQREEKKVEEWKNGAKKLDDEYGFDPLPYVNSYFNSQEFDRPKDKEAVNKEIEEEVQAFIDTNQVGDMRRTTSAERRSGEYRGKGQVAITEDYIAEGIRGIKSQYGDKARKAKNEAFRAQILEQLPEEIANDPEKVKEITDYLWFNFGINSDLDGNGMYGEADTQVGKLLQTVLGVPSAAINTGIDLTLDPAMYLAASAMGTAIGGVEGGRNLSELYRESSKGTKEALRALEVKVPEGFSENVLKGNAWAAANSFSQGLGASIPSVALAAAGPVGWGALGAGSGTSAYMEAKDDPAFENDWQRLGWGAVNGSADALFAWTTSGIGSRVLLKAAQKGFKEKGFKSAFDAAKNLAVGNAYRYGIAMPLEAAEEMGVAAIQGVARAGLTGEDLPSNYWNQIVDAGVMGAVIGGFIGGNTGQKMFGGPSADLVALEAATKAATLAKADIDNSSSKSKTVIEGLMGELKATSDPQKQKLIKAQIKAIETEERARQDRKRPFYTMMSLRHPEVFDQMRRLDLAIAQRSIAFESVADEKSRENIREEMESLVAKRMELEGNFKEESLDLTLDERRRYNEHSVAAKLVSMQREIESLEAGIEAEYEAEGTELFNENNIREMARRRGEVVKRLREAQSLVSEANAAIEAMENTEGTELGNVDDTESALAGIRDIEARLADALGMDFDAVSRTQAMTESQSQKAAEAERRQSDTWVNEALTDQEATELTREGLEAILASSDYAILTAENPNNSTLSEEANLQRLQQARNYLRSKGLKFYEVKGRYDKKGENSLIVEGMTVDQAKEFAREFAQHSVVTPGGLVKADGSVAALGEVEFRDQVRDGDDMFTAVKLEDGSTVAFARSVQGEYKDVDGKKIKEDAFWASPEVTQEAPTREDGETVVGEPSNNLGIEGEFQDLKPNKDGTFGVREGDFGLSSKDAASMNRVLKALSLINPGFNFRVHTTAKSGDAAGGAGMGGFVDFEGNLVHISPEGIKRNMTAEAEAGFDRTKSFQETILEEVLHANLSPLFAKIYAEKPQKLRDLKNNLIGLVKSDKALMDRIKAKAEQYERKSSDGNVKNELEVLDEVIVEIVSAISGDQKVKMDMGAKLKLFINRTIDAAMGRAGRELKITSDSSALSILSKYVDLVKSGQTFTVESAEGDIKTRKSAKLYPSKLPDDEPFVMEFNKTYFDKKFGAPLPSRIGQQEFNGKWHFINWFNFMESKGVRIENADMIKGGVRTPVNIDAIRKWKFPEKPPTDEQVAATEARKLDAAKHALLNRVKNYISPKEAVTMEKISNAASELIGEGKQGFRWWRNLSIDDVNKINDALSDKGFDDGKMEASSRGSFVLRQLAQSSNAMDFEDFKSVKRQILCGYYADKCALDSKVTDLEFLAMQASEILGPNPTEQDVARLMAREFEVAINDGPEGILDLLGNYRTSRQGFLSNLASDPNMPDNVADFAPLFDMVVAFTSNGLPAETNLQIATKLFYHMMGNIKSDGKLFLDGELDRLGTRDDEMFGDIYNKMSGRRASMLMHLKDISEVALRYYDPATGEFRGNNFKEKMRSKSGDMKFAQNKFGGGETFKLGAWAINLMGDESVLTQDLHVMDQMALLSGEIQFDFNYMTTDQIYKVAEFLDVNPNTPPKILALKLIQEKKNAPVPNDREAASRIFNEIFKPMPQRKNSSKGKKRKQFAARQRVLEDAVGIYNEFNPQRKITVAQAGQILYAAGQTLNTRAPGLTLETSYTPYDPILDRIASDGSYMALSRMDEIAIERAMQAEADLEMQMVEAMDKPDPTGMKRSSMQLSMLDPEVKNADESPLFVYRSAGDGVLEVRAKGKAFSLGTVEETREPNKSFDSGKFGFDVTEEYKSREKVTRKVIENKQVGKLLREDGQSRAVMAKGIEVQPNQKVGVRLNLNVMKSSGVPVQTIHDKTATGEALSYAPAVLLRNVQFNVNQNERQKIATFQESKSPMASVDGSFVTTDLSAIDAVNGFSGVRVRFNPLTSNLFTDMSGRPIKSAEEVTVIGNDVFVRGDVQYYSLDDPIIARGKTETEAEKAKRIKRGPKYDKAVSRFRAYSENQLGVTYETLQEARDAYDSMTPESKVALDESEIAANMEQAMKRRSIKLKLRQTSKRAAARYGDAREAILTNPESYISPQNLKDSKADLEQKSNADLIEMMTGDGLGRLSQRNDDMGVLAGLELLNRAVASGNPSAIPGLVDELAKIGTTAGRLLRHFGELKSSTPLGMTQLIVKEVERRGNKLSDTQTEFLENTAAKYFKAKAEFDALMKRAIAGEDVEAELAKKQKEVKLIERELDTFTNVVVERGWGQLGTMLIQGNLLTPISQVTNIGANIINALVKVPVDVLALPVEKLSNMFGLESPMNRNYSINAYMYGLRKFGSGFVEAAEQIITGQERDVAEWRVHRGFAPFRSIMAAMTGANLPLGPDGKASASQRLKLFAQGTVGLPAEVMFRFLSLGDTPFRRMAEGVELYHAGRSMGLEGEALKRFLKYPTKKQLEAAEREGRKLTFQQRTAASKMAEDTVAFFERTSAGLFNWIPGVDGEALGKFLVRTNVPYVRTPANILYETLIFTSPYVGIPVMMKNLKDGDAREASQTLAKMTIGSMAGHVASILISEGLISGPIEWDEDEEKNIAYDQFPPSSINVTGLQRWINGESTAKQPDDYFVSYNKLGIIGTVMGARVKATTDAGAGAVEDPFSVTSMLKESFGIGAFSSISHMLDQSFLSGINGFLDVISAADQGGFERASERWLGTTFQAISAVGLPNTLSALYRADREYLPDTRVAKNLPYWDRIAKKFEYTVRDRTFNLGEVPARVNWKGEPIQQTPRGTTGMSYNLFDITKSRQGEADMVSNEIWRLYEQTEYLTRVVGTPRYASTT